MHEMAAFGNEYFGGLKGESIWGGDHVLSYRSLLSSKQKEEALVSTIYLYILLF